MKFKFIQIALGLFFVLTQFQNCGGVSFSTKSASLNDAKQSGPTCQSVIENNTGNLRIIVIVDNSGSTLKTDPNFKYRQQTLVDFLAQYGAKTNFTYAFGEFGADAANFYNYASSQFESNPASPFGTSLQLQNALQIYLNTPINDKANTPYQLAFDAVSRIIASDTAAGLVAPSYSVVFMSDGMPNPKASTDDLKKMVDSVLNAALANGRLATVSTVYFGAESSSSDASAMDNLKIMANEGLGQFYDTNNPPAGGLIENAITVPGQVVLCAQGS